MTLIFRRNVTLLTVRGQTRYITNDISADRKLASVTTVLPTAGNKEKGLEINKNQLNYLHDQYLRFANAAAS